MYGRRILLLADLHIGSIKSIPHVYNIITDIFDKELIHNKTDAVIFLGDYFHQLLKGNSEYMKLAVNIMTYLMLICYRRKIKVRMIYGTESHDSDQYGIFNFFEQCPMFDFRVIRTATKEMLFWDAKVLYLPEEYINNKQEFYKELFDDTYDFIFGHGVISEGMPMVKPNKNNNEKKVPHFKSKELAKRSKVCVFGHYHILTDMGDNVYYLGSLFRNSFGEEIPKGYGIIENKKFKFIENPYAYIFNTYEYKSNSRIYESMDKFMKELMKIKLENKNLFNEKVSGKIRIIFHIPDSASITFKENIKSIMDKEKLIHPVFIMDSEEDNIIVDDEDNYIIDNSYPIEDKIHRYINKTYNYDISPKDIGKFIYDTFVMHR